MNPITLRWFLEEADKSCLPLDYVLEGTGIEVLHLEKFHDVDIWCYAQVMHRLAKIAPAGFGKQCGQQFTCEKLGEVGLAMMTSATLWDAAQIWAKYGELAQFPLFGSVRRSGACWLYEFGPHFPATEIAWRFCAEALVSCFTALTQQLSGSARYYERVELPFKPSPHAENKHFDADHVQFGQSHALLIGRLADIEVPSRFANGNVCRILTENCQRSLETQHRATSARERVFKEFAKSRGALSTISGLAKEFGVSTRTLQRNIASEGSTYQELVHEFRQQLLRMLDEEDGIVAKSTAYELGFKDTSGVYRLRRRISAPHC